MIKWLECIFVMHVMCGHEFDSRYQAGFFLEGGIRSGGGRPLNHPTNLITILVVVIIKESALIPSKYMKQLITVISRVVRLTFKKHSMYILYSI